MATHDYTAYSQPNLATPDPKECRTTRLTAEIFPNGLPADAQQVGGTHYKELAISPWDAMAAWMTPEEFRGFLRGNAIKYLARAGRKGTMKEDILKAQHYLAKLVELL